MDYFFNHLIHEFQRPLENPVLIFSIILFIILMAPVILKRINIPSIIGLIISGVVIGPNALNIIQKSSAVELFSTIGLLYIMFIAGLELDMNDFKRNKHKSVWFGFFTFIIPIAIGYPVCRYLLGYDVEASFLTASMFATHTLVAYPLISKMGVAKNQAVAVTVGGTILTDTAVLLILALVLGSVNGGFDSILLARLSISMLIFGFIMFGLIPPFARWFFNRLESEHYSHYIFVLSIVFFAAFLSEVAGVEPIIGAFAAGLALNRLIPHSSALMNRIEFIGNSLFIPFFLISVGMVVDIKVLFAGPTAWIVAGALTITALFSKWIAAFVTQKIFNYSGHQRQLIFGLSSAHAAATLAIILVGFNEGILDENILNGTIILILITCIVASFAAERAAKSIITNSKNELSQEDVQYELITEHILLSAEEDKEIDKLLNLAILIKNKKSVQPVSVLSVIPFDDEAEINIIKEKRRISSHLNMAAASETHINYVSTIDQNIGSGIARTSREVMANLILLPWPGQSSLLDKFMSDKIESVVGYTDKSIFVVQINQPLLYHTRMILVIPPMGEMENGFVQWANKMLLLAKELNLKVMCFCQVGTYDELTKIDGYLGYHTTIQHEVFSDWEDFLIIARHVKEKDLVVCASARKGSISYFGMLDNIPSKLEKHFTNSKIVIYPQQFSNLKLYDNYLDINAEPISQGIKTLNKLKKGLGGMLKKNQ
ncbi:MAG: cation:proton antiporter [Saprospiraceae bacterium]|nr:cation:proton antiporter [Saprospiraceae bacterium]MBK8852109.1 cation:proton antiporter [Saprospiraceae bacterium]